MTNYLYRTLDARTSAGLLALRLITGAAFMLHGWPKMQNLTGWMGPDAPVPGIFQALAGIAEFGGGFAWIIGALMPLASFGILATMTVATWTMYQMSGGTFVAVGKPSFELPLLYFAVALLFLLSGPGKFSVDALLFGRRNEAREPALAGVTA